jgi:hypothetical protein
MQRTFKGLSISVLSLKRLCTLEGARMALRHVVYKQLFLLGARAQGLRPSSLIANSP